MLSHRLFRTALKAAGLVAMSQAAASAQMAGPTAPIDGASKAVGELPVSGSDDLKPARQRRLANGVRYTLLPRGGKEPGFTIYMRVAGGFYAERRPGERGLVHLIEHIAFKGSSHLEPGALQRIGQPITFPAPSAASTSWQNSSYYLTSRNGDRQSVDTLLMLFREIGSELTFPEAGVKEARVEVLKEMADKRAGNATFASYIAAVAPGSPNDVIEAQNSDDVPIATVATLRDLYHRLYRPDRTSIIIVGRFDPDAAEALIRRHFENWKATADRALVASRPTYERGKIRPISYSADPAGRSVVTVSVTMRLPSQTRNREQRLRDRIMDITSAQAASARLRQEQPTAPVGKVGTTIEDAEGYRLIRTWDFTEPDQWAPALTALRQQVCNLYRVGWTQEEWDAAKNATLAEMEADAKNRLDEKNIDVAGEIADAGGDAQRILSRHELANYASAWLPSVRVTQANARWRRQWRAGVEHTRVETPKLAAFSSPFEEVSRTIAHVGSTRCRR